MRIAMLHTDLPPAAGGGGGVRHQVAGLCESLAGRGHEVVVHVVVDNSPSARPYQVQRAALGRMCGTSSSLRILVTPMAFALGRYDGFDVIHAHGDSELLLRRRIPTVRTFYGSAADEARYAVTRKQRAVQRYHHRGELVARRLADLTVGISEATAGSIGRLDHIIPCGVDRQRFQPGPKTDRPTVLFIGTMRGRKRGDFVARAFREHVRAQIPDARLVLIAPDAIAEPGIEAISRVSDAELAELVRSAWLLTLPSAYEGFGVPYIEAMSSGTAVLATPNAGALELFCSGKGGIVVSDVEFGETMASLLTDGARRDGLARLGREVSERFDWEHIASSYEHVYRQVMDA